MKKQIKTILLFLIPALALSFSLGLFSKNEDNQTANPQIVETDNTIAEEGSYTSKEDVALYLYTFNKLPGNFISKAQAKKLGWEASKGNLQDVCKGCSIGGDSFGNREGLLPKKSGRKYYECDIDYQGGMRNEKRIVFSNDGLIYYSDDHYNSFTLLYGEP